MISVALCTFNGEKYIKNQIASIIEQSQPVDEIIIIDDCSSDSTNDIVKQFKQQYPHIIHCETNKINLGFRKNFEKALKACSGDFIFFSDQDDVWLHDKVKKSIEYLNGTGCWGAFSNANLIDSDGNNLGVDLFDTQHLKEYASKSEFLDLFTMLNFSDNFVTGATLVITKEAKDIVIPFKTSQSIYHDYYIALKLAYHNKLGLIIDKLIDYRVHSGQQIGVKVDSPQMKGLFDYYKQSQNGQVEDVYVFLKYLIKRRKNTIGICLLCDFSKEEKEKVRNEFKKMYFSCIYKSPFFYRLYFLFRFYCVELHVSLRMKIKFGLQTL